MEGISCQQLPIQNPRLRVARSGKERNTALVVKEKPYGKL